MIQVIQGWRCSAVIGIRPDGHTHMDGYTASFFVEIKRRRIGRKISEGNLQSLHLAKFQLGPAQKKLVDTMLSEKALHCSSKAWPAPPMAPAEPPARPPLAQQLRHRDT